MIDLNDLRERPDAYQEACRKKRLKFDVKAFIALDQKYRSLRTEVEQLRSKQNSFSKEIPKLTGEAKERGLEEMKQISSKLKEFSQGFKDAEEEWNRLQLLIPTIPSDEVPEGDDDGGNVEIRKVGSLPKFSFTIKDHVEIGKNLDILDIERGVKVGGARQYFLKGDGMRLQHAVMQLALDKLHSKGYLLMDPPHIVKFQSMLGTGYFPGGEEQAFHLDDRDKDLYLIGTSEVSVCSYHMDELLPVAALPKRYAGYSPCYRREAGSYGRDTHGIYRIHQFYKVEQVIICKNDVQESAKFHAELLGNAEEVMKALELPYRVVNVCGGDLGQGQVYKNDIETWMPSRDKYSETHSCSTFHEYQSRRLNLRYKDESGKNFYCHTLNNTLVASPRILIPLLEINQNQDGSVNIPKALRPYMGGQEKITARE